jgi:hypothetical protein
MAPPLTWITPFLNALRKTGIVAEAARQAQISYSTVSARKQNDADFEAAMLEAMEEAVDMAEAEAWRRGVHGYSEPLTHQGQISYETESYVDEDLATKVRFKLDPEGNRIPITIKKHSDALLALVLKGRRKKVFADRTELTGADGGDIKMADSSVRAARVAQLMALAQARKAAEDFGDIA